MDFWLITQLIKNNINHILFIKKKIKIQCIWNLNTHLAYGCSQGSCSLTPLCSASGCADRWLAYARIPQVSWRMAPPPVRASLARLRSNWGDYWQARLHLTLSRPIYQKKEKVVFDIFYPLYHLSEVHWQKII